MINVRKLVTYCMIGTIAFASPSVVTMAAERPVAGIDLLLNDFYQNQVNEDKDVKAYLSSDTFKSFANLSFANVNNYVNIRKKPSENSKILGKLYNNSAATVISKKGDWYRVKSGSVTGYIKGDYLVTGTKAAEIADKAGTRIATVNTTTLKVRKEANTESSVITLVPIGEKLTVKKEADNWVKITVDSEDKGYVSADYVDLTTVYDEAISIQEEKEKLAMEEAAREQSESHSTSGRSSSVKSAVTAKVSSSASSKTSSSAGSKTSSTRSQIVNYALKFEGNPYVWGGTSLTNGTDCSGFTQSVFRNMGIRIPRDSRSQAASGKKISVSSVQPGDLIFYSRGGSINHVAIYIGNGRVISASSPSVGIRVSSYDYRTPVKAVSYIN